MDDISENKLSSFYEEFAVTSRFDNADTINVKRMLQHILPEDLRNAITTKLFNEFVRISPEDFLQELCMNIEEVSNLIKNDMYVGSQGSMHYWLDRIFPER